MMRADVVDLYELLKPKLGEQESKALLHFVEDRTITLVQDEIAKGLVTKDDLARLERATKEEFASLRADIARLEHATKEDIVRLERATKEDIVRLEKEMLTFKWQMRVYLLAIAALIVLTNPRVLDLTARLLGITAPGP